MKVSVLILLLFLGFSNCRSQAISEENAVKEIVAYIADLAAFPLPPPSPPKVGATTPEMLSKEVVDSLKNIKLKVAVYPFYGAIDFKTIPADLSSKCKELIVESKDEDMHYIEPFSTDSGHWITTLDTKNILVNKEYKGFDMLLRFSKFYFNNDFTKVVFEVGASTSKLAGKSTFYCLEKRNGTWNINYSKEMSVW